MLAATPSGIALGPEGRAHQSINTPPSSLSHFEPANADVLAIMMEWSLRHMHLGG